MKLGIKDKVALVTGAGRGLGKGICETLSREGARLIVCSRTKSELEELIEGLGETSAAHLALVVDV